MSLPDPLDVAAGGDWDSFIKPLIQRAVDARDHGEPMHLTVVEVDELKRRTKTTLSDPFDGDVPLTFFGVPVVVEGRG